MTLVQRVARQLVDIVTRNRYEAAQPSTPKRSYVPAFMRDARYDANSWSRWEMTRKIRYFERNVWLVQALGDCHEKWTIGTSPCGIGIVPASSDSDWNEAMAESYGEFCESPCADSTINMGRVHRQIARSDHFERDIFVHRTVARIEGLKRPAIQLIESHRCSGPGTAYSMEDRADDIVDGVQLEKNGGKIGRPLGYWIIDNLDQSEWTFRSVEDMDHVFDPERPGMYRGITPYHSVMNTLHDLDDLESLEMEKAKGNASIINIIKTITGQLNADAKRSRRYAMIGGQNVVQDPKSDANDQRIQMYQKILGARTLGLRTDENFEQVASDSPSASTQWYWRIKMAEVCKAGGGVPLALLFPEILEGLQGTLIRGIFDDAHESFKLAFFRYACEAIKIYHHWANWARYNDKRCLDAPADWKKCHVTPPRAVNVDIGYTSAATLAELAVAVTNYDDIAGRQGTTAETLLRKKVRNIVMLKKIIEEETKESGIEVEIEEVVENMADVIAKTQAGEEGPGEDDDDGNVKKKNGNKNAKAKQNS